MSASGEASVTVNPVRAPAQATPARRVAWALAALLALRLALGFAYSAVNPLGEAPDEADHYAYVAYIGENGRLPEGTTVTQSKHPPLYHALAAAAGSAAGLDFTFLRANPDGGVSPDAQAPNFFIHTTLESWPWAGGPLAMHLGRFISVLAGVVLVIATYGLARALWPESPALAFAAAAFVAFLPEALFIGGSVSNDMLAAMFAGLALWAAVAGRGWLSAIAAGLCMGLGFLTKASVVAIWPAALAALLIRSGWTPRRPLHGIGRALLAGLLALAMAAPWLWRNWQLYGDPLGTPVLLGTIDRRTAPLSLADLWWLARGWFLSFWGKFGAAGHISLPWPFYAVWIALVVAAVAGWLRRNRTRAGHPSTPQAWFAGSAQDAQPIILAPHPSTASPAIAGASAQDAQRTDTVLRWTVLAGAPVLVVLSMVSYSRIALGTDQGRLLFPALAPLAVLLTAGLARWTPGGRESSLPVLLAPGMAVIAALALVFGIIRPFAPPAPPPPAEAAASSPVGQVYGDKLELTGIEWSPEMRVEEATVRPLTLYWRANAPIDADLRTIVRMMRGDALLWEWKRSPAAGRWSTDRWTVGRPVADMYRVPAEAAGSADRVEVLVYAFPDETPLGSVTLPLPES
jgi:4-amino-4-deoxy-L-arabinose transferase-like glycosyltransferase